MSPPYALYPPVYMAFADPPDFMETAIRHPFLAVGLDNFDHQSELYRQLILSTILQSSLGAADMVGRKQRMDALLEDVKNAPDIRNDINKLEFVDMLIAGGELRLR